MHTGILAGVNSLSNGVSRVHYQYVRRGAVRAAATALLLSVGVTAPNALAPSAQAKCLDTAKSIAGENAVGQSSRNLTQGSTLVSRYHKDGGYFSAECDHSGKLLRAVRTKPHRLPDNSVALLPIDQLVDTEPAVQN